MIVYISHHRAELQKHMVCLKATFEVK